MLFLTANDTEEDMLKGYDVGCDDYISKPFSIDILRRKVSAILKRTITENARVQYKDLEVDMENALCCYMAKKSISVQQNINYSAI